MLNISTVFVYSWFISGLSWFPGATLQSLRKVIFDIAVVNNFQFSVKWSIVCLVFLQIHRKQFFLPFFFHLVLCALFSVCAYMTGFLEVKKCISPSLWYTCWDLTYLFSTNTEVTVLMRELRVWDFPCSLRLCIVWNGGGCRKAFWHDFCPGLR